MLDRDRYCGGKRSQGHYVGELTVGWIGIDIVEMRGAIMHMNSLQVG